MDDIKDIEDLLPPKPMPPKAADCCGTGCYPCVHDIYEQDINNWKKQCDLTRSWNKSDDDDHSNVALSVTQFIEFKITNINKVSPNSFIYTFHIPENKCLGLKVGQHAVVKQHLNGKVITRQYTPISDIRERGFFDVLVKIYSVGRMTSVIKEWKEGDLIPWRGPFGRFEYKVGMHQKLLLLAAGTGIAPMYQIIKAVVENADDETIIYLVYASKSFEDILLRDELLKLTDFWNFTMCHFLSQENAKTGKRYREEVEFRKITKDDILKEISKVSHEKTHVLICGTKSFEKDMINYLKDEEFPDANVFRF
ncbi:NADH-cytochrome b5 reductase-like [Oratosquilla oratoria]|uniref:NADH-cytochrome b5 reductase-like n=1 Tax=Oratosquilla oratoria TaxID=337810 RepID=UPI003F76743E